MKRLFCCVMGLCLLLATPVQALSLSAASACLLDCDSGRILYAQNESRPGLIASTTKIMTALIVAEQCNPDARVRIPQEAVGIEGSSMYLEPGEILTVRDLLYGLMLHSGNDAAVALAIYCAGDVGTFVDRMNQRAAQLGLRDTEFANPNGLDHEHNRSTAEDMARLAAHALENEIFREIVGTRTYSNGLRTMTNHNKLLWRYDGAIGVKTGYTRAAGRILVSAAERDGRRLVAVTMNAPDDWNDHTKLLDYGFEAYREEIAAEAGECLSTVPVVGGAAASVAVETAQRLSCALLPTENCQLRLQLPPFVYAPLEPGDSLGEAVLLLDGREVARTDLLCVESVRELLPPPRWYQRLLAGLK